MTPEEILKHDARVLTQAQREAYFDTGYVSGEGLIPNEWLVAVRAASDERIEASRQETESGSEFDLAPEHTSEPACPSPEVARGSASGLPEVCRPIAVCGYCGRPCWAEREISQLQDQL